MKVSAKQTKIAVSKAIASSKEHMAILQTAGIYAVTIGADGRLEHMAALDKGLSGLSKSAFRYFVLSLNKAVNDDAFGYDVTKKAFTLGTVTARNKVKALSERELRAIAWSKPADKIDPSFLKLVERSMKMLEKHWADDVIAKPVMEALATAKAKLEKREQAAIERKAEPSGKTNRKTAAKLKAANPAIPAKVNA